MPKWLIFHAKMTDFHAKMTDFHAKKVTDFHAKKWLFSMPKSNCFSMPNLVKWLNFHAKSGKMTEFYGQNDWILWPNDWISWPKLLNFMPKWLNFMAKMHQKWLNFRFLAKCLISGKKRVFMAKMRVFMAKMHVFMAKMRVFMPKCMYLCQNPCMETRTVYGDPDPCMETPGPVWRPGPCMETPDRVWRPRSGAYGTIGVYVVFGTVPAVCTRCHWPAWCTRRQHGWQHGPGPEMVHQARKLFMGNEGLYTPLGGLKIE